MLPWLPLPKSWLHQPLPKSWLHQPRRLHELPPPVPPQARPQLRRRLRVLLPFSLGRSKGPSLSSTCGLLPPRQLLSRWQWESTQRREVLGHPNQVRSLERGRHANHCKRYLHPRFRSARMVARWGLLVLWLPQSSSVAPEILERFPTVSNVSNGPFEMFPRLSNVSQRAV